MGDRLQLLRSAYMRRRTPAWNLHPKQDLFTTIHESARELSGLRDCPRCGTSATVLYRAGNGVAACARCRQ